MEEYVRVFEPLLFEECRAQLYSTWEELIETVSRDTHIMVRVKANEPRERGTLYLSLFNAGKSLHFFKKLHFIILLDFILFVNMRVPLSLSY